MNIGYFKLFFHIIYKDSKHQHLFYHYYYPKNSDTYFVVKDRPSFQHFLAKQPNHNVKKRITFSFVSKPSHTEQTVVTRDGFM